MIGAEFLIVHGSTKSKDYPWVSLFWGKYMGRRKSCPTMTGGLIIHGATKSKDYPWRSGIWESYGAG
jgi:hypothetical protein